MCKSDVKRIQDEWTAEKTRLNDSALNQKKELQHIIEEVMDREKHKEQIDITDHQSLYELIRNKNIEEDHQMRSNLEEKIEQMKDKCNAALNQYRGSTETSTQDYRTFLARDALLSKHVEKKLRQVERMQTSIALYYKTCLKHRS